IYNKPVAILFEEMLVEDERMKSNNWPSFLFDDHTNNIVSSLHLNLNQQDLFGLLYLYDADYLKYDWKGSSILSDYLKVIPYEFISRVGSIQLMNIADGLENVLRYVRTDFLLKVLKLNPEAEFDIYRLDKSLICEFIDDYETFGFNMDYDTSLHFNINMHKAQIVLPFLEKSEIHFTDGHWANPPRDDVPDEILEFGTQSHHMIRAGLETVTKYYANTEAEKPEQWMWKINDKGRLLLEWFRKKE
ncbi:MAG: hypothetical protein K2N24_06290, partial [Lachnospiraceae bacterium]|nr:hypothetical protein [Lachnospiraceae bacterium]